MSYQARRLAALASQSPAAQNLGSTSTASNPNRPLTLTSLPTEILVRIGENLPLSNAAAFELCCKATWKGLDNHFSRKLEWPSDISSDDDAYAAYRRALGPLTLTPGEKETQDFMLLLERDTITSIYCHYCRCLHAPELTETGLVLSYDGKEIESPASALSDLSCTAENRCSVRYHKDFTYANVRMLMNISLRSLPTAPYLQKLNHTEIRPLFTLPNMLNKDTKIPQHLTLKGLSPQIVRAVQVRTTAIRKVLLVREQNWILISSRDPSSLPPTFFNGHGVPCEHINLSHTVDEDRHRHKSFLLSVLECGLEIYSTSRKCKTCFQLQKCDVCQAEYQVNILDLGFAFAAVVTSWKNLGACQHPGDLEWSKHFDAGVRMPLGYPGWNWEFRMKDTFEKAAVWDGGVNRNAEEKEGICRALAGIWRDREGKSGDGMLGLRVGREECTSSDDGMLGIVARELENRVLFPFGVFDGELVREKVRELLDGNVAKGYA